MINGKETDQMITLSEDNNWAGNFTDLLKYKNGKEISYTVKEVDVPDGYTSTISQNGNEITITNTYAIQIEEEQPPVEETPESTNSTTTTSEPQKQVVKQATEE